MWLNYLKTSLRNFLRSKLYSFINIFGLAVGLACAILIGLYVNDELSYDSFQPDADRLYRISRDFYASGGTDEMFLATLAPRAAALLEEDYPEFEQVARTMASPGLLARDEVVFYEDWMQFADPALLRMFSFDFISGDPDTALNDANSIVLTERVARKYFGDESPMGQSLRLENLVDFTVTGVIRDLPGNTHLRADVFMPLQSLLNLLGEQAQTSWGANMTHTYVKLAPGADMATIERTFPDFMNRHLGQNASQRTGLYATKVTDIHLHSDRQLEMGKPGSMATVVSLTTVALGIVLIACFNFMNLSTARSVLRGKEVGVRKTIGAERRHLILQFLGESISMTFFATLVAVVMVELALPAFNAFTGKTLVFNILIDARTQLALALLVLTVGTLAGSYPALYLSSFKPAQVLKSRVAFGVRDVLFRNLLVILQFSISIVLIIATTVVILQTRYARNFDLGFDKERIVVLTGSPSQGLSPRWEALRQQLLQHSGINSVTASNIAPGVENLNTFGVRTLDDPDGRDMAYLMVDYDFFETYAIEVLAGRAFTEDFVADRIPPAPGPDMTGNFILNESAARELGWTPNQALDQQFEVFAGNQPFSIKGYIVGVVADSNFESVRFSVKPLVFILGQQAMWNNSPVFSNASIRITGNDLAGALAHIDASWKEMLPEFPINRRFLSDSFEALYQDDQRLGELFSYFAALAILIACLGLFGLATFNAQRRTKEIGVRKVMGGSVMGIVLLLTNDFSKLVLISNLVAWPVAYLAMNSWLANFAYRIDLTPLIFMGSGLIALCVAWVTVGGTAAKAASAKPVLALRYE